MVGLGKSFKCGTYVEKEGWEKRKEQRKNRKGQKSDRKVTE